MIIIDESGLSRQQSVPEKTTRIELNRRPEVGSSTEHADGSAWRSCADALTAWTLTRLVNRTDAWGVYSNDGRTFTAPPLVERGKRILTPGIIRQHFQAAVRNHLIGLHAGSPGPESTAKRIAADIDKHGDSDDAEANLKAAIHWFDTAVNLGFQPLLTDSNGAGGYHLRIHFCESIALSLAYRFGRWLFRDASDRGMPDLEVFPKQTNLAPKGMGGQFGNWLRVPGRHHKRNHWSSAWNGSAWLSGADAIDYTLGHRGDSPNLIPPAASEWTDRKLMPRCPARVNVIIFPGRTTAYAAAALKNECRQVEGAYERTRNATLNKAAFSLGRFIASGELDRSTVETQLSGAARNVGLDEWEIAATIRSGIDAGMAQPRGGVR